MKLSVVVPVYNEQENLPLLYQSLHTALDPLEISYEVILVDDGSRDGSRAILEELASVDPVHIRVLELRRNFGQTPAIAAGIDYSCGDTIVLMDADMQNDPADIPMMLDKIDEGYDVVSGWRINRQDAFLTRTLPSTIANWMISRVTGVRLHDYGCTLKAYCRDVLTGFRLYGEMHRFIPAYANSVGAKIVEVPVHHHPRQFGQAKYGLERTVKVILDLFTVKFLMSYSNKPIYLFGGSGMTMITVSFLTLLFLFIRRTFYGIAVYTSPLFGLATTLAVMGFQAILMGLIAELQVRTYHESQGKPTYTIRKAINLEPMEKTPQREPDAHTGLYP